MEDSTLYNIFFELLQISIGVRQELSHAPSEDEWEKLYETAKQQALVGICFAGIERLPENQRPPRRLLMRWYSQKIKIEKRNALLEERSREILRLFEKEGIRASILKGQGVGRLYEKTPLTPLPRGEQEPQVPSSKFHVQEVQASSLDREGWGWSLSSLRQSGDIDVYVDCGREKAIEFAKKLGEKDIWWDYKHLHLNIYKDTEVEVHYRVEKMKNLIKNKKLQAWVQEHESEIFSHYPTEDTEFVTPSVEFNAFYILLHTYSHFLSGGVGLRQVMDYYFVLKNLNPNLNLNVMPKEFGILRFTRGLMWVLVHVFELEQKYLICEPDEKEGRIILNDIIIGGNFGHNTSKKISGNMRVDLILTMLKHNIHLFKYYPTEVLWSPIYIVWHKIWKMTR